MLDILNKTNIAHYMYFKVSPKNLISLKILNISIYQIWVFFLS